MKNLKNLLKTFLTIGILISISSQAIAESTTWMNKGDKAPHDGYLFTEESTRLLKKELIEKDLLKQLNTTLEKNIDTQAKIIAEQGKHIETLQERNLRIYERIGKESTTSNYEKALWFGLGIIGSGLAVYGAAQLVR